MSLNLHLEDLSEARERLVEANNRIEMLNGVAKAALTLWRNTDQYTKQGDPDWEELMEAMNEADLFEISDFRS